MFLFFLSLAIEDLQIAQEGLWEAIIPVRWPILTEKEAGEMRKPEFLSLRNYDGNAFRESLQKICNDLNVLEGHPPSVSLGRTSEHNLGMMLFTENSGLA